MEDDEAPAQDFSSVAIVIACYNQAHFLPDALRSALAQSLPAHEVVLVDDGSTDMTEHVGRAFPGVRYIHQSNAGLAAARNTGLNAVTTPYVLFLDADDTLDRDALAFAVAALAASPSLAFVFGGYREVDETLTPRSTHPPRVGDASLAGLLCHGNYIAMHGTVLYRCSTLRSAGGFDPALASCEDYDVYLRLARTHAFASYPHIAADYRRHGASMSLASIRMIKALKTVLRRHSRTRSERRLARSGFATMLDYYAPTLFAQLSRELRIEHASGILRFIACTPALWPLFMRHLVHTARASLWRARQFRRRQEGDRSS